MTREWQATCKDCGATFAYSDASLAAGRRRGMSRPERCSDCRRQHAREIAPLGLSHLDFAPLRPPPDDGLRPGRLGALARAPRLHRPADRTPTIVPSAAITDDHMREFHELLATHRAAIVEAPTGAGKSTVLPWRLLAPPDGVQADVLTQHGQIIVTQPRQVATRAIPERVAAMHGCSLGAGFEIGYRHRGATRTDWRNRLVYMTDGTLINLIVRGELDRVSVVMIDEAHERSVNIDLILGLLKAQLALYPQLRVVVASATIDTGLFVDYFAQAAPTAHHPFPGARQYPIERRFRPEDEALSDSQYVSRAPDEVAGLAHRVLVGIADGSEPPGDLLVFLQGKAAINRAIATLERLVEDTARLGQVTCRPLYAELDEAGQARALTPSGDDGERRVVVATNVAETSLTVEGIVHVVDSGLINEARWDPVSQIDVIAPKRHSRAGCEQRWGRAGRVAPGVAHCLYTESQFDSFEAHTQPEIARACLDQVVLAAKAAGVDDVAGFDWIQRPDSLELERAPSKLVAMGALDEDGDLTEHGRELRGYGTEIDEANLMVLADRYACVPEMAATLAVMSRPRGWRGLLEWDYGWTTAAKRDVDDLHRALVAGALDDLDAALKIVLAWDAAGRSRREWAERHAAAEGSLEEVTERRAELVTGLTGHRRTQTLRPLDVRLIDRVRMVMARGLPHCLYALRLDGSERTYRPYVPASGDRARVAALHQDAQIEVAPLSRAYGRSLEAFVAGARRRAVRRISPFAEPEASVEVSFCVLVRPEWLDLVDSSPVGFARHVAAATRDADGMLDATDASARLLIDQAWPLRALVSVTDTEDGTLATGVVAPPPPLALRQADEVVLDESADADDAVVVAGEGGSATAGLATGGEAEDDVEAGDELSLDELGLDEERDSDDAAAGSQQPPVIGVDSIELHWVGEPTTGASRAVVLGFDYSVRSRPVLLAGVPDEADTIHALAEVHSAGDPLEVEVVGRRRFGYETREHAIVRAVAIGAELVLTPGDLGLSGRNVHVESLSDGQQLELRLEELDPAGQRLRASWLDAAVDRTRRILGRSDEATLDAIIAEVHDSGVWLWLDPDGAADRPLAVGYAHSSRLPDRPDAITLGARCRVTVRVRRRARPLARRVDVVPERLQDALAERWAGGVEFGTDARVLRVHRPMPYAQREALFALDSRAGWRRAVDWLFRRSNELDLRVHDVEGLRNLEDMRQSGTRVAGTVIDVHERSVVVRLPDGHETTIGRRDVSWKQDADLREEVEPGEELDIAVVSVDDSAGRARLRSLRDEDDPMLAYEIGMAVQARVVEVQERGVVVEVAAGVRGFIPLVELSWAAVEHAEDAIEEGAVVEAEILSVETERRRLRLSARRRQPDPLDHFDVDDQASGTVVRITQSGSAVVALEAGVDGLIPQSEVRDAHKWHGAELAVGDGLPVRVVAIDRETRRVRLSGSQRAIARVAIPASRRGAVIGQGGSTIRGLQERTGARIDLGDDGAVITGSSEEVVRSAVDLVEEIAHPWAARLTLTEGRMGMLIGSGGETIKAIRARHSVDIECRTDDVTVTASDRDRIVAAVADIRDVVGGVRVHAQIPPERSGLVIGSGGSTITAIRERTGAFVRLERDRSGRLAVEGDSDAVNDAIAEVRAVAGWLEIVSEEELGVIGAVEVARQR